MDEGNSGEFGEFEEVSEAGAAPVVAAEGTEGAARVRMPKKGEVIGIIAQRYGGNRMDIHSTDGKKRNCRVPGRFKKFLWLRPRDIVLIQPWPDDDAKGDIIFKYTPGAVHQLRKRGLLNNLPSDF